MASGSPLQNPTNWWETSLWDPDKSLPSRSTVGPFGVTPSGGGQAPSSGSEIPWGQILTTGAGLATSLASGNRGSIVGPAAEIQRGAREQMATGQRLVQQGSDNLDPVLKYFRDLFSGNPADVMAATAPQRKRVLDQYDTARKSSAEFTPRGGGQASAQMESRASEASDLAMIGAGSRAEAANTLASLGSSQQQVGLAAEQHAQAQLAQVLGPLLQQEEKSTADLIRTYAGYAALVAAFL